MDENYIDKKLKDILESPPEFSPDEAAVADMRRRLGATPPKKRTAIFPFLWPLLFLPLFIGAWFFYKKYEKLEKAFTVLNSKFIDQQNSTHTRDSIFTQQTIYKIDTVYEIRYQVKYLTEAGEERSNRNPSQSSYSSYFYYSNRFENSRNSPKNIYWSLGDYRNSLFAQSPGSSYFNRGRNPFQNNNSPFFKNDISLDKAAANNTFDLLLLDRLSPFLKVANNDSTIIARLEDEIEPALAKRRIPTKYFFMPSGYTLGVKYSPVVLPITDYGATASAFGIYGGIKFPRNQELTVGVEYLQLNFEIEDAAQISEFPVVAPTDPTDVLHEAKGNFSYLQIPVILSQRFRNGKDFQPRVSAGIVAYRPIAYDFVFEYIDGTGEYKTSTSLKEGSFSADNLRFGVGGEYRFWRKLSANFELQYQHGFSQETTAYFPLRFWGINVGLDYQFE
ncbi:MAG: outer membrane beta-barrel protein [Saprospiraceae bacterium]